MSQSPGKTMPGRSHGQGSSGGADQQPKLRDPDTQLPEPQCSGSSSVSPLQELQSRPEPRDPQEVEVDKVLPQRPHSEVSPTERGTGENAFSLVPSGSATKPATLPAATRDVLCHREDQMWPTRVVSSPGSSQHNTDRGPADVDVQILATGDRLTTSASSCSEDDDWPNKEGPVTSKASRRQQAKSSSSENSPGPDTDFPRSKKMKRSCAQPSKPAVPQQSGPVGTEPGQPSESQGQPAPMSRGSVVWVKLQELPYWPAVVQSRSRQGPRARVLLLEAHMCPERRGITVALSRLKALHCPEEPRLQSRAARRFPQGLTWCLELLAQYSQAQASGAFTGPLLSFWATDASLPLRRAATEAQEPPTFPSVDYAALEGSSSSSDDEQLHQGQRHQQWGQPRSRGPRRRRLPDRTRSARDRENQKLVDFIVKERGADAHLMAVVQGHRPSHWLQAFMRSGRYVILMETYLEDDEQTDTVVAHLRAFCRGLDLSHITRVRNDLVSFVVEVLLPEAIICGLCALEGLDYQAAQAKYLQGPPVHQREKEDFDRNILKMVRKRASRRVRP